MRTTRVDLPGYEYIYLSSLTVSLERTLPPRSKIPDLPYTERNEIRIMAGTDPSGSDGPTSLDGEVNEPNF